MTRGALLDTQTLVALAGSSGLLGKTTLHLLRPPRTIHYSPLSIAEIRLKEALRGETLMSPRFAEHLGALGLIELPLNSLAAAGISRFPGLNRHDPFDRLLLAQAAQHGLQFVTTDSVLIGLELDFVHDGTL